MILIRYIFSKPCVSLKKFHWHIEFDFDNPTGRFESEIQKNFAQNQKAGNQLKLLINTSFVQNDLLDVQKEVRTSPHKRCHQKVRKLFAQWLKMPFQLKLLSNQIFIRKLLLQHVDCKFYAPAEKFSTKTKKNRSESDVDIKSALISKTLFSSESGYVNLRAVLSTVSELFREESKTILVKVLKK